MIHRNRNLAALVTFSARLALVAVGGVAIVPSANAAITEAVNGAVGMTTGTYSASASAGSVTLTAQRVGGKSGAISVTYTTIAGSAAAGKQFTAETGKLTWANGDGANKTFKIPLSTAAFTGTKSFAIRLTAGANTMLGAHTSATINISGSGATTTTPTTPTTTTTKSIKQWVSCSETIDETAQVKAAIDAAANHAFTLIIDCPVRLHTGTASESSIAVPNGVTIEFQGSGEMLAVSNGPPALTVADPSTVSFINWNYTYL